MLKYVVALISVSLALWHGSERPNFWLFELAEVSQDSDTLLSPEELSLYNGREGSKGLYLAILGQVFDVETGRKHYGPDGGYRFFTGISTAHTLMMNTAFQRDTTRGRGQDAEQKVQGWSWT